MKYTEKWALIKELGLNDKTKWGDDDERFTEVLNEYYSNLESEDEVEETSEDEVEETSKPEPIKKEKVPNRVRYKTIRNKKEAANIEIGEFVQFRCNFGRIATNSVGDLSQGFIIKKFQKGVFFRGRFTPLIRKLIRSEAIILTR
jgi:hypothetical protein